MPEDLQERSSADSIGPCPHCGLAPQALAGEGRSAVEQLRLTPERLVDIEAHGAVYWYRAASIYLELLLKKDPAKGVGP